MQTKIETSRLVLRPFQPSDAEVAFTWFSDPVVMQFTVTGPDKSIEDTRRRLTFFEEHQRGHGFSKWVILDADSGVAIGDSGLLVLEEYRWIDLGFRWPSSIGAKVSLQRPHAQQVALAFKQSRSG
jgi:ribosomal-protein-alanine N-acetyltransferase